VSHPTDADLDPFDALRVIDNCVRVLRLLGLAEVAYDLSALRGNGRLEASAEGGYEITAHPPVRPSGKGGLATHPMKLMSNSGAHREIIRAIAGVMGLSLAA
jgi:hypothetical protein